MNNLDKKYQELLQNIIDNGVTKQDRTGTGTISVFGKQIRHKMSDGFPLLTTKKMPFKLILTELLWFLKGDTNIKFLVDNGCNIWNGDAYKNYLSKTQTYTDSLSVPDDISEFQDVMDSLSKQIKSGVLTQKEFIIKIKTDDVFAKKWGDLGPIYGKQWRCWKRYRKVEDTEHKETLHIIDYIDQITNLINELKTNPDSRRLMVSAWNVDELDKMTLPPCHYGFQVYTRELTARERIALGSNGSTKLYDSIKEAKYETIYADVEMHKVCDEKNIPKRAISLMWNQRSVDTFLGLPFNIASYGLLLEIIAKVVNMVPDELIGNLGDVHLYSNHIEQAKEQIGRDLTLEERFKLAGNHWPPGGLPNQAIYFMDKKGIPKRTREPFELPKLNINTEFWPTEGGECGIGPINATAVFNGFQNENFCKCLLEDDIQLYDYQSHPTIKAPLSN
jgi:thymidylate synthase